MADLPAPDPTIPAAVELARELRARPFGGRLARGAVVVSDGIWPARRLGGSQVSDYAGMSVGGQQMTHEERTWLSAYAAAGRDARRED